MEQEPKIDKNQEEKLRKKYYQIEKARLPEGEPRQCDECVDKDNNFQFYQEGWIVEGQFYCPNHKDGAVNLLEKIDNDAERKKLEQERIIEERRKQSGLK